MAPDDPSTGPDYGASNDIGPFGSIPTHLHGKRVDGFDDRSDETNAAADSTPITPPVDLALRLEVREVANMNGGGTTDTAMPALMGAWAWLLSHDDGKLISYSDGYGSRSACIAAAKRVGWPMVITD